MSDTPPIIVKYRKAASQEPAAGQPALPSRPVKPAISHVDAMFRISIVVVMLASMAMAYWSFFHQLTPMQQRARAMVSKASGMSATLDELERRWTPEQAEDIRERYAQVYSKVFADQAELEDWISLVHSQAAPLSLDIKVEFGASTPSTLFATNLAVIPASIVLEVKPTPGEMPGKSPYERLLLFSQKLAAHGKRADLAELSVLGGSGSVSSALLVFNLWAGDLGNDVTVATNLPAK